MGSRGVCELRWLWRVELCVSLFGQMGVIERKGIHGLVWFVTVGLFNGRWCMNLG